MEKFSEFDEYQLGKHGQKVKKEDIPIFVPENDEEDDVGEGEGRDERELAKRRFSVKRLIRLLHIKAPVYHVMAILGKKYVALCSRNFQNVKLRLDFVERSFYHLFDFTEIRFL